MKEDSSVKKFFKWLGVAVSWIGAFYGSLKEPLIEWKGKLHFGLGSFRFCPLWVYALWCLALLSVALLIIYRIQGSPKRFMHNPNPKKVAAIASCWILGIFAITAIFDHSAGLVLVILACFTCWWWAFTIYPGWKVYQYRRKLNRRA